MAVSRIIPTSADTDLLTFTIKVDGEAISREYQVANITVNKAINKIPSASITIVDGNPSAETFPVSDEDLFLPGKDIEIALGYHSSEETVFKGIIVTHANKISSSSSALHIECKDAVVKMTVGRNSKHYNNVTYSDVAEELIGTYAGVTAAVESTAVQHKDLVQFDTTDWDFIVSGMDSIGCICLVNDGTFTTKKPALGEDAKLEVLFGASILEYNAAIDTRLQYKGVKASAWDFTNQQVLDTDAAEPAWVEGGNISNSTLADTIGLEKYKLIHSGKITQNELQAWADAKLMKARLGKIKGMVKFMGSNAVLPGDFISLNGTGGRFTGKAIAAEIRHECLDGMWTTAINFGMEPEWFASTVDVKNPLTQKGLIPSLQGLQVGIVNSLEDPDGENRVQVKMPMVNSSEDGVWARVATLDAGNNRGSFFLPEVGDEVILGCINNDPSHIVILGMMNSSAKPAPLTAANANNEKGYVSREQVKMIFNDDEKSFRVETPGGNKITLSDKDQHIKIEDQNGNIITMEPAGITIESASALKLKAAADLTIEAVNVTVSPSAVFSVGAGGAELKAGNGSASIKAPSVKVEGSGLAEIKGGLVKIN